MTKIKISGIIPARGGSNHTFENIKPINHKPLINYSIESVLNQIY